LGADYYPERFVHPRGGAGALFRAQTLKELICTASNPRRGI
jgi:hypothetical protein